MTRAELEHVGHHTLAGPLCTLLGLIELQELDHGSTEYTAIMRERAILEQEAILDFIEQLIMETRDRIVAVARGHIGQTEKEGNSGFTDPKFQAEMRLSGWQVGYPWCSYFAETVWRNAYAGAAGQLAAIQQHFSGSAVETYTRFQKAGFKVSALPVPGALAVWRYGNGWQGHIGVVSSVSGDTFRCIEGNTNDKGGREGYIVAERLRKLKQPFSAKGLNLVGFILPI